MTKPDQKEEEKSLSRDKDKEKDHKAKLAEKVASSIKAAILKSDILIITL